MANPESEPERELVERAINLACKFGGYCEWERRAAIRIRSTAELKGLLPAGIKTLLCDYVARMPGSVSQVVEKRAEYSDRRHYFKVVIPVPEFSGGLFVELILTDDDPTDPTVLIVNAHEQGH